MPRDTEQKKNKWFQITNFQEPVVKSTFPSMERSEI